jgi:peptidyl-prolyl cis-trans isomerase C
MQRFLPIYAAGLICIIVQCCTSSSEQNTKRPAGVVAQIGSVTVTTQDLTEALKLMPQSQQFEYLTDAGKKLFLETLIDWKLLAQEAVKAGLEKDEEVKVAFKKASGTTGERDQILGSAWLRRRMQQLPAVSDEQVQNYFLSHPDEFSLPARIQVDRIMFETREKAREALPSLREGMPFDTYRLHHPQSRIKVDTLWLQHADKGSETAKVAAGLAANELSEILAVNAGYCLLRVRERVPARSRSFEEIRENLRARLRHEHERALIETIKKELRRGITLTVNEDLLATYQCAECAGRVGQQ